MKKMMYFFVIAGMLAITFTSCKKDKDDEDENKLEAALIKTIGVEYTDGVETYRFVYDANKRIDTIYDYWNDEVDKILKYDYSVPGKLTIKNITSGSNYRSYELNAQGMVSKEDWGGGEYAQYTYDANGFLTTVIEHWGDADHLKYKADITNGNIIRHTTYDDDGVTVKKIKEFFYTPGDNVFGIYQASLIDNTFLPMGNLFGKPSAKLVQYLEYWDPRQNPIVKGRTDITYEFDAKNRITKMIRKGADWQEVYTFTYY
ncbi:MAG: hypothetical protein GX419_10170 [Bacteroidales bacterium]|nr:hypothetical protein [Bacteroidales bacterium]